MKNPSTRRANQWAYPPDSDTLAPREQIKFLPDEDEETTTTATNQEDENEPANINLESLSIDQESTVSSTT